MIDMLNLFIPMSVSLLDYGATVGYVGPGAGLTMLSALLAVILVLLFALLAPFLYVVRMVRAMLSGSRTKRNVCLETQIGDDSGR